ncbi:hypothetical protein ACQEVF_56510 [Nonomuraea polychroma]|uniref:hypothetical protein n=1 Tax=Nonomuraea polychroma TaxID=46176 RepID=UPI003D8B2717
MEASPARAGFRRRAFRWMAAAAILLTVLAAISLAARLEPPTGVSPGSPEEVVEADPSSIPSPLRVTVDPPSVPAGTRTVRVTAFCADGDSEGIAVSDAFSDDFPEGQSLDKTLASGGRYTDAQLDPALRPGTYRVLARCSTVLLGMAELVVTQATATPTPSGPARTATTRVSLAHAQPGAWRAHPDATKDRFQPSDRVFELKITHELRIPADDPEVSLLREGSAASDPTGFAVGRLGAVDAQSALNTAFQMPVVTTARDAPHAVITFTGVAYGLISSPGDFVGVDFSPPAGENALPLSNQEVVISAAGWTLAGVRGSVLEQDRRSVRLNGDRSAKAAFVPDGQTASVAGYLAGDLLIGRLIEGDDEPGTSSAEDVPEPGPSALGHAWIVLQWLSGLAALLVLLNALVRALGREWWRRRRNQVLVAMQAIAYVALMVDSSLTGGQGWWAWTGVALLAIGLPLLAVGSAACVVPGGRGVLITAGSVMATLTGLILSVWALLVVVERWAAFWWSVAVLALAAAVAAVPRWRRALPVVGLLALAAGLVLVARLFMLGFVLDVAVWLVPLALSLSVLALGWVAEADRRWSPRAAAYCVTGVWVTLSAVAYAMLAGELLFSWGLAEREYSVLPVLFPFAAYGVPLLAFVMLVVRVRRIGREPAALTSAVAFHTAVLYVLVPRAQVWATLEFFGVTILLAWAGICWLVPSPTGQGSPVRTPVTGDEHRLLVRDLLRRRFTRAALTELLRQRQLGEESLADFEERRTALERASDDHTGPVDSDFALSTLAGRTPWQNALAGLAAGLLLSLPFSTVRIIASAESWRAEDTQLLLAALPLLSLPVLCMVFGYFYPRVRGVTPITKALALLVAALLIELPVYVQTLIIAASTDPELAQVPLPTPQEAWIGVGVAVGNIAVVSIGLGLWWEWRLMWLAGEPWARVRNIRSLHALAAPLAAVVIAVATTMATALVNNVIAPLPTGQIAPAATSPSPRP